MEFDVFTTYEEINEAYAWAFEEYGIKLSADKNCEQLGLIVCARKWTYSGLDKDGPDWPIKLELVLFEHILVGSKLDIFIYEKVT